MSPKRKFDGLFTGIFGIFGIFIMIFLQICEDTSKWFARRKPVPEEPTRTLPDDMINI